MSSRLPLKAPRPSFIGNNQYGFLIKFFRTELGNHDVIHPMAWLNKSFAQYSVFDWDLSQNGEDDIIFLASKSIVPCSLGFMNLNATKAFKQMELFIRESFNCKMKCIHSQYQPSKRNGKGCRVLHVCQKRSVRISMGLIIFL